MTEQLKSQAEMTGKHERQRSPPPVPDRNATDLSSLKAALPEPRTFKPDRMAKQAQPAYLSRPINQVLIRALYGIWTKAIQPGVPKELAMAVDYIARTTSWDMQIWEYPIEYEKTKVHHPEMGELLLAHLTLWRRSKTVRPDDGDDVANEAEKMERMYAREDKGEHVVQIWTLLCTAAQGELAGRAKSVAMRFGDEAELRMLNFNTYYRAEDEAAELTDISLTRGSWMSHPRLVDLTYKLVQRAMGDKYRPDRQLLQECLAYTHATLEKQGKKVVKLSVMRRYRIEPSGLTKTAMISAHYERDGKLAEAAAAVIIMEGKRGGRMGKPAVAFEDEWPVVRMPSGDPWVPVSPEEGEQENAGMPEQHESAEKKSGEESIEEEKEKKETTEKENEDNKEDRVGR